jgi:NADPH-dependent curcumin reductase CurA
VSVSLPHTGRQVHLIARPQGEPRAADFAMVEAPVVSPGPGQIVVRNEWMSVDPYMRRRMDDVDSYIEPFKLDEAMSGAAVGTVIASESADFPVGMWVRHFLGWREYATLDVDDPALRVIDVDAVPAQRYLSVLGMTGLTAYVGLTVAAPLQEGDTVFISGAAGAVGHVAGRVARALGAATVIGSAGGPEKVWKVVEEFGYDAAIDYKAGALDSQLEAAAPDGIDVYFDNVGGPHLEAAIGRMRVHGRVALCGAISQYNSSELPPGPRNLLLATNKRLSFRGFIVTDHLDLYGDYVSQAIRWITDGSLHVEETVVDGIENAPAALMDMLQGVNTGKMLVRLGRG